MLHLYPFPQVEHPIFSNLINEVTYWALCICFEAGIVYSLYLHSYFIYKPLRASGKALTKRTAETREQLIISDSCIVAIYWRLKIGTTSDGNSLDHYVLWTYMDVAESCCLFISTERLGSSEALVESTINGQEDAVATAYRWKDTLGCLRRTSETGIFQIRICRL